MKRTAMFLLRTLLWCFGTIFRGTLLVVMVGGIWAFANYTLTQGSGTTFGSIVVASVHYMQLLLCDPTMPSQCAAVDSSGHQTVNLASGTLNPNGQAVAASAAPVAVSKNSGTGSTVAGAGVGTAGTASAEVVTVQGIASGTVIPISAASLPLPTGAMGSSGGTVGLAAGTAAIGTVTGNVNVTPTNCSSTITSGGTAQNAIAATATIHGFTIANIDTSAGSGEPLWISFTTTAAASTAASYPLAAPTATTFAGLSSFTTPLGFGMNTALSVIAATTGHKFSCTYW
jgi:hypothetical protein